MASPSLFPHRRSRSISTRIFVGNLSYQTTEEQLSVALREAGTIRSVFIGKDRETGRSRGFAFIEFEQPECAKDAIRRFDGCEIDGRKIRLNPAEERPARGPAPGGFPHAPRPPRPPQMGAGPSSGEWRPSPPPFESPFPGGEDRGFRTKGSRRNMRARKRSLRF